MASSAVVEYPYFKQKNAQTIITHWHIFIAASFLAVIVNVLANVVIKTSGSTTLKILSTVRGPILLLPATMLFGESIGSFDGLGYVITLGGFMW